MRNLIAAVFGEVWIRGGYWCSGCHRRRWVAGEDVGDPLVDRFRCRRCHRTRGG